jgi:tetratricopeptide (TPR) repeat protein
MKKLFFIFLFSTSLIAQNSFEKAEKLYEDKKYEQAKDLFESYLKLNPNHLKTLEYLGDIAFIDKNWDKAIEYYKKMKDKSPKTANHWYKYGGALGMKAKSINKFKAVGMIDDIKDAFHTAANLDKKHINVRWALVMFYMELPAIVGGSETKAKKYAEELLDLSKVDGYLAKGLIEVYNKEYKEAEKYYLQAHKVGNSKTTFEKLYDLYLNKLKDKNKAAKLKEQFNK